MEAKEKKETRTSITRREALKRIALATGGIAGLGSLDSWAITKSGVGFGDMNQPEQQKVASYLSYYSSYGRYTSYSYYSYSSFRYNSYSSLYTSYSSFSSGYSSYSSYSSTSSSPYSSYSSTAPSTSPPTSPSPDSSSPSQIPPGAKCGPKEICPGVGIAGILVGMNESQVVSMLGKPEEIYNSPSGPRYINYKTKGLSILIAGGCASTIFAYSGRKGGYDKGDYRRYEGSMQNGLNLNSKYPDVIRLLGTPDASGDLSSAPIPSKWVRYNKGISFDFITATGELIYISVSGRR